MPSNDTETATSGASDIPPGIGSGSLNGDEEVLPLTTARTAVAEAFHGATRRADPTTHSYWEQPLVIIPDLANAAIIPWLEHVPADPPIAPIVAVGELMERRQTQIAAVLDVVERGIAILDDRDAAESAHAEKSGEALLAGKRPPAAYDRAGYDYAARKLALEYRTALSLVASTTDMLDQKLLDSARYLRRPVLEALRANTADTRTALDAVEIGVARDAELRALIDVVDYGWGGNRLGQWGRGRLAFLARNTSDGLRSGVRQDGMWSGAVSLLRNVLTADDTIEAIATRETWSLEVTPAQSEWWATPAQGTM